MGLKFLQDIVNLDNIQFVNGSGTNAGLINMDGNDLVLSNPLGDILLGDGASDVYIGDGTNNVDILFEQSGSIKADDSASGVTLTLGSSNTTLAFGGNTSFADVVTAISGTSANAIDLGTNGVPFRNIYAAHHVGGSSINYATSRGWVEDAAPLSSTQGGFYGGDFTRNGDADENALVRGQDPFNNKALLWKCILHDTDDDADGGWNKNITIPANNNIGYLSYCYFMADFTPDSSTAGSRDGTVYLGCGTVAGQTINISNNASNTNPYFVSNSLYTVNNGGPVIANRWYLMIGVIQPYNDETTGNDTISGVYDVETGERVATGSEFKMGNNTTSQVHRAYVYYDESGDAGENVYFWNPGFHAIDGSEPKLQDLLKRQIYLNDNIKAAFGDSDDLQLLHDGSNSYIHHNGAGSLYMKADTGDINIINYTNDRDIIFQSDDGSGGVTPYLTLDGGDSKVVVGKQLSIAGDNRKLTLGASDDLQIYHDGSHSYIKDSGTGNLRIDASNFYVRNSGGTKIAIDALDGAEVALRYNNVRKLETTSAGVEVQDVLQVTTDGTATLILRGDNNNSQDTGQLDSTIKMLHDDGTHGILMETKNFAGKQRFEIKSLSAGTESSRFVIHEDNYITTSGNINGRDIATDGTKLDTIATNADVTPSWVPSSDPSYLTAHPNISAASSVNNSGLTHIQDITLDSNGHVTGIVSHTLSGSDFVIPGSTAALNEVQCGTYTHTTDIAFVLDTDNNETASFIIKDGAGNSPLTLTEAGDLTITGKFVSTYASKASSGDILVEDSGEIKKRTPAELKTDLSLNNVPNTDATNATNLASGTVPAARLATTTIAKGGTGSTTASGARTALGLGSAATSNTGDFAAANHNHDSDYAALSHNHAASSIVTGTLADARISESSVTQHEAALSITEGQLPDDMPSDKVKQICTTHHNFYKNGTNQNNTYYFPFNSFNEGTNTGFYYLRTVAPYNGRIVKIVARADADLGTSTRFRVHVINNTNANFSTTPTEQVTVDMSTANTGAIGNFTSSSHFSAGDAVGVGIRFTNSTNTGNIYATVVWEYTL